MNVSEPGLEDRVLVLAPTGKDAALIIAALRREGLRAEACGDGTELAGQVRQGVGAVLVAEEAITPPAVREQLQSVIDTQPSWSDLPVLLLSKVGPFSPLAAAAVASLGNVTVLERPTQIATLSSAVLTALRTRERQYRLRTADERKDAFLATLAHELRNPLAPLSNALHMLKRDGLDAPQRTWALDIIQRQSLQMTRLVDDLLDVARITQGKVSLQREHVDARELIRNAAEISAPMMQAMQHRLTVDVPATPIPIDADAVRITQCISNLLNNAAKYTPHGGTIGLAARLQAGQFVLSVQDSGIGIPAAALAQVFDIFSQVDRERSNAQGGLGIGLSIVKAFVEMHGGTVEAASDGEGQGSRFSLRLPAADGAADAAPASAPVAASAPACRILVVDDNVDSADSLAELLEAFGHQTQRAYTGRDGLAAAERQPPDIAILDIGLPDIDGLELCRRLRARAATARTVLVALSGWGQAADRERSRIAGFDHHLVKPADLEQIESIIREAAERAPSS